MDTLTTPSKRLGAAKARLWISASDLRAILAHHSDIPQRTREALKEVETKLSATYNRIDASYE